VRRIQSEFADLVAQKLALAAWAAVEGNLSQKGEDPWASQVKWCLQDCPVGLPWEASQWSVKRSLAGLEEIHFAAAATAATDAAAVGRQSPVVAPFEVAEHQAGALEGNLHPEGSVEVEESIEQANLMVVAAEEETLLEGVQILVEVQIFVEEILVEGILEALGASNEEDWGKTKLFFSFFFFRITNARNEDLLEGAEASLPWGCQGPVEVAVQTFEEKRGRGKRGCEVAGKNLFPYFIF